MRPWPRGGLFPGYFRDAHGPVAVRVSPVLNPSPPTRKAPAAQPAYDWRIDFRRLEAQIALYVRDRTDNVIPLTETIQARQLRRADSS